MNMNPRRLLSLALVLVFSGLLVAATKSRTISWSAVPNTAVALPKSKEVRAVWAVPPDLFDLGAWQGMDLGLDGEGAVWLSTSDALICPSKSLMVRSPKPLDGFVVLGNGEKIVLSEGLLGTLTGVSKGKFQSLVAVPVSPAWMTPADSDSFYLWGKNRKTGRSDVYLVNMTATGLKVHVLFSTEKVVTAVGGDASRTFVALGPLVVRLTPGVKGAVKGVFKATGSDVNVLALPKGSETLFYATDRGVGCIDTLRRRRLEFFQSPNVNIVIGTGGLYAKLWDASGVVKISGLSHFLVSAKSNRSSRSKGAK
jgi:hypothetical protein